MARRILRLQHFLWVSIALICSLTLLSISIESPIEREITWFERVLFATLSPFQHATTAIVTGVREAMEGYVFLIHVERENQQLKGRNSWLESQQLLLQQLRSENTRLKDLLRLKQTHPWSMLPARVIAHSPLSEFRLITINRGADDGLKKRMPVIAADGLVGQVYRVSASRAQVLLITDPIHSVDAQIGQTGARGLLRGQVNTSKWDRTYYLSALEFVDRAAPVEEGATVTSSGLDGLFPEGIPIGTVRKVQENPYGIFQEVDVMPLVHFMALREVLVITDWQKK